MKAPTMEACQAFLADNPSAIRRWSCGCSISLLATARFDLLWEFGHLVDPIDARGNTLRCRLFCDEGKEATALAALAEQAQQLEVTLQLLCDRGPIESSQRRYNLGRDASVTVYDHEEYYPIVWLNFLGEKWPEKEKEVAHE